MRVLVMAPHFPPATRAGGPVRSLSNLAVAASRRHQVDVIAGDRDMGSSEAYEGLSGRTLSRPNLTIYYVDWSSPYQILSIVSRLHPNTYDVMLLNNFWSPQGALGPALLSLCRILQTRSVVLMPRGELEAGALELKSGKKRLSLPAYTRLYGRAVDAFASTSSSERATLQRIFPGVPVLATSNEPDPIAFSPSPPRAADLQILFVGRIHQTKGLIHLLDALSRSHFRADLKICGFPEDKAYWARCLELINSMPIETRVSYLGEAKRSDVASLYSEADVLVSLTAGENFGHTIAEALQAGTKVITTPYTPWTPVLNAGGGIVVHDRTDSNQVSAAISKCIGLSREQWTVERQRVRAAFEEWLSTRPPSVIDQVARLSEGTYF